LMWGKDSMSDLANTVCFPPSVWIVSCWHGASAAPSSRTIRAGGKNRFFMSQTRKIITSVAFMRAAAVCPRFSCISRAERAVMIEVIC